MPSHTTDSANSRTHKRQSRECLWALMSQRILVLEGPYSSAFQGYNLAEEAFRGEPYAHHDHPLQGNHDILNITQPAIVAEVHNGYLATGCDIISTNTFNATAIAQHDFGTEDACFNSNEQAAQIARQCADAYSSDTQPRFVAGSIGPTNRTASISPDVNRPEFRNVDFVQLCDSYLEAARGYPYRIFVSRYSGWSDNGNRQRWPIGHLRRPAARSARSSRRFGIEPPRKCH